MNIKTQYRSVECSTVVYFPKYESKETEKSFEVILTEISCYNAIQISKFVIYKPKR